MTSAHTLQGALDDLAHVFGDPTVARDIGPRTTCAEANTIARALRVSGHHREADAWLAGHTTGDSPNLHHHALATATANA